MFETSVVRARAMGSGYRYRFLTLSLAMHTCALGAVLTATLISTRLPDEAPKQMSTPFFMPAVTIPPPLGTPHPRAAAPQQKPASAPAPSVPTAPRTIPDQIVPTIASATSTAPAVPGNEVGDDVGDPNGVIGGIRTETEPVVAQPAVPDAPIRVTSDMKAPIVLHRVLPDYPRVAMLGRMNGWVIVECIIDRSGRVRDAKVLKSSFPAFEQPAIDAVQQWVFSPGMLQGQPVDVIFDLTVNFQLK